MLGLALVFPQLKTLQRRDESDTDELYFDPQILGSCSGRAHLLEGTKQREAGALQKHQGAHSVQALPKAFIAPLGLRIPFPKKFTGKTRSDCLAVPVILGEPKKDGSWRKPVPVANRLRQPSEFQR